MLAQVTIIDLLARQTPGFSGADIANVCNEAALIAARHGKKFVGKQDFLDAVDRIVGGLEKKTKITTEAERRSIAIHEAGHASISWLLEYANPLIKVTIVPRGRALGAAWYLPEERQITTKEQMLDEMCATLGGRAAEDLFLGRISTGAMNDLERETITQEDTVVCVLGEHESQSGEAASRAFLTLPEEQQVLFEKIAERITVPSDLEKDVPSYLDNTPQREISPTRGTTKLAA